MTYWSILLFKRLLPTGCPSEEIRTRASFDKIQANYTLEESITTAVYDKNIIYRTFRVSNAAVRAEWLHSLNLKASINNRVNILNITMSRHTFVCRYPWTVFTNFTKIGQINIPNNFAQSKLLLPKSKARF